MKLSVIGLGKLGLPMATLYASKGFDVVGVDSSQWLINQINKGYCPIHETGLLDLMEKLNHKLNVTCDCTEAVTQSDITFIIVPTPSGADGKFANDYILSVLEKLASTLATKKEYHLVVITSTVMPGSCQHEFIPLLERLSGKKCGYGFGLCYNPEFIALGSVIKDMCQPDAVLIGESDKKAGDKLEKFYRTFHKKAPPLPSIHRMGLWNAEVAKISLNVFITTKISLANTFAQVCERIPGGDIDALTKFLGSDSRIGHKYLRGGVGFAGTCFPRDNRAFITMAHELGLSCPLQEGTDTFNLYHNTEIAGRALAILNRETTYTDKVITILGVTYKPQTNVVEESPALDMIKRFTGYGYSVKVYDPEGMGNAKNALGDLPVYWTKSIPDSLKKSDLCIITVMWEEFKLKPVMFLNYMRTPVVLDCWRMLDKECFSDSNVKYYALGVNNEK